MQILTGGVLAIILLVAYVFLSQAFPLAGMAFLEAITLLMPWVIVLSHKPIAPHAFYGFC